MDVNLMSDKEMKKDINKEIIANRKIIIIAGPTAAGKSAASLAVAKKFNGEIISADSAQIYRYMNIGTAKMTVAEMEGIPHHLIDIVNPDEVFSVSQYRQRADLAISEIFAKGKIPIITGGTGLYINSVLDSLEFTVSAGDEDFRNRMEALADNKGNEYVHDLLKTADPEAAEKLHPNDVRRVIRALEVFESTGKKISEVQRESRNKPMRYECIYTAITDERSVLYDRINKRVDTMLAKGLSDEVRMLLEMGYSEDLVSMRAIGYKEVIDGLKGRITWDEMIDTLKMNSRRYAKRQLTWFRRDERVEWFDLSAFESFDELTEKLIYHIAENLQIR